MPGWMRCVLNNIIYSCLVEKPECEWEVGVEVLGYVLAPGLLRFRRSVWLGCCPDCSPAIACGQVVFESGLSKCQDSLIGGNDGFFVERGLSGKQAGRKVVAGRLKRRRWW